MTDWIANGPDGSELIGYLAGLGWLVLVGAGAPPGAAVTLRWERHAAGWRPRLTHPGTPDDGWRWLGDGLRAYARAFGADLPGPPVETVPVVLDPGWKNPKDASGSEWQARAAAVLATGRAGAPIARDLLAGIISDVRPPRGGEDGLADTRFRMMQGNGGQDFLVFARRLLVWAADDVPARIGPSLAASWRYADEAHKGSTSTDARRGRPWTPSMRWDPRDSRPHAVLSRDPERKDLPEDQLRGPKKATEAGGSTLAVAALAALPVLPGQTLGWARLAPAATSHRREDCFTWGLHERPLDLDGVRALLRLPLLSYAQPSATEAAGRGIADIRRAARVMLGKYPAITQAWTPG